MPNQRSLPAASRYSSRAEPFHIGLPVNSTAPATAVASPAPWPSRIVSRSNEVSRPTPGLTVQWLFNPIAAWVSRPLKASRARYSLKTRVSWSPSAEIPTTVLACSCTPFSA